MTNTKFDEHPECCYCRFCMITRTVLKTTDRIASRLPHLPTTDLSAIDSEIHALVLHLSDTEQNYASLAQSQRSLDPDDFPW